MTEPAIESVAEHRGNVLRAEWRNGSAVLRNMRPILQSPALRRCGTRWSGALP